MTSLTRGKLETLVEDLVQRRALSGLVIQAFEAGQSSMDQKKYDAALHFFDLALAGSKKQGWGHYYRARVYAAMADKKHMLAELKFALEGGFTDPTALAEPEFAAFQKEPEFQEILRKWSAMSPQ